MRKWFILVLCGVLLCACTGTGNDQIQAATPIPFPEAAPTVTPVAVTPESNSAAPQGLDLQTLKNFSYQIGAPDAISVTMVNGSFTHSDPSKTLMAAGRLIEPVAYGDLNGDGTPEAALIIATNYGGSGTFHELIVLASSHGVVSQAASLAIGDRVQEKQLSIQNGRILLDMIRHGANDPMCCPSEHVLVTYQYQAGTIKAVGEQSK